MRDIQYSIKGGLASQYQMCWSVSNSALSDQASSSQYFAEFMCTEWKLGIEWCTREHSGGVAFYCR